MATYLYGSLITITRQEGDTADLVFTVPDSLSMTPFTEVKFQLNKGLTGSTMRWIKKLSLAEMTVALQVITIPLNAADTTGYSGNNNWELEVSNATPTIITIGKGTFVITKEIIKP